MCWVVITANKLTKTIPIHHASLKHAEPQIFPSQAYESLECCARAPSDFDANPACCSKEVSRFLAVAILQIPEKCFPMLIITKIFSTRHSAAPQMLPKHKLGQLCSPSGGGGGGGALQRQCYRI
jgi:hypothetical protein